MRRPSSDNISNLRLSARGTRELTTIVYFEVSVNNPASNAQ
jgi:hypothetical protein